MKKTITGKQFRRWRRNLDIVQQEVADYCDVNISTISRWENGLINLKLCNYLKVLEYMQKYETNSINANVKEM